VLEAANQAESKINHVKKNVQALLEIDAAIGRVMTVLNPLISQLQAIKKALNLNIKLPEIPGLDKLKGIVESLTSVFDPMTQAFDRLLGDAQALQTKLQSLFELTQPFNKIYQACVQGRDEQPAAAGLVLKQNRAEADPAVFDAAVSYQGRTYLFQGDQFFVSTAGEDTRAQGPHPIKSYWGSDNREMPLDGPFDAVTLYADRLYIRKGESYWDQPIIGIKALN
jgi:hypothetical protein